MPDDGIVSIWNKLPITENVKTNYLFLLYTSATEGALIK